LIYFWAEFKVVNTNTQRIKISSENYVIFADEVSHGLKLII
jgi:hypothetical protein